MTVTAEIDVTRPVGRKLVRELENKRCVKMSYPAPFNVAGTKTYTLNEVYDRCCERMSNFYGVDVKQFSTFV